MKKIVAFAALGLILPALAFAAKPPSPGSPAGNQYKQPPGYYCAQQHLSKTHVDGQKGTPFSQCIVAMAQLAKGTINSPKVACAALSHKHVAGQKGTPFSQCVTAGAKLLQGTH